MRRAAISGSIGTAPLARHVQRIDDQARPLGGADQRGFVVASQRVAALARQVVRVMPELTVPPLPVWLTAHRELRGTPRLKAR